MYENFKCWKYNSENGWVELQNMLLPTITWYMNWWGSYDPNPNNLHLPGGMTSLQIHAVFEQLKALIVLCPGPYFWTNAINALPNLCYLETINASPYTDTEILSELLGHDIFCFRGHGSLINGISALVIYQEGDLVYVIMPDEVSNFIGEQHRYKFVYLNGCVTGITLQTWQDVFNSDCTLGFLTNSKHEAAEYYDQCFWSYIIQHYSVYEASDCAEQDVRINWPSDRIKWVYPLVLGNVSL